MVKKDVIIRWFPPSWLLIQGNEKIIYVDPAWIQKNFYSYPKKIIFSHYPEPMDGLPEPDLPKADIVLVTHHHQDHIKTATLRRLTTSRTKIYAPEKCAKLIGRAYKKVCSGDEITEDGIKIRVVDAYNTPEGKSSRKVHHKGDGVGYLITIKGKTIYHAGDTDVISEMSKLGSVNVAFLPIGGTFTMNIDEAVRAVKIIEPRLAVPMHFLKNEPAEFVKLTGEKNAKALNIGESVTI